ncbi:LytTR family DNA-binding domain-containing protein [Lachnospiraceae bacterium 62-35]
MNELRIALCEDEQEEREHLLSLIQACTIPSQISVFENGDIFLKNYEIGSFDLIFMDIYMDGISGIEAIRHVRNKEAEVPVAFITTSQDHALDGYRLNVAKYIEKPVSKKAIDEMLKLALYQRKHQPGITVFIHGKPLIVPFQKLLFVEQKAHYLIFHLLNSKIIQTKGKLDELMPQVIEFPLFRCHKSFLVNLSFVTGIDKELMVFHMREGSTVYIRRENFKKARTAWENWLFSAARKGGMEHE